MRKRTNLLLSCNGQAIVSFQSQEEIALNKRRRVFFRSNVPSDLCLFSMNVRKQIEEYKQSANIEKHERAIRYI